MTELDLPQPTDDFEEKVIADIREVGWHCISVSPEAHPEHAAQNEALQYDPVYSTTFAYTVGVWTSFGHPELILVGPWAQGHPILNVAIGLIAEGGARFRAGDVSSEVVENYEVRFDAVSSEAWKRYLTYAAWVAGRDAGEALQLVLPDREGRWPDDPEYDAYPQPSLA